MVDDVKPVSVAEKFMWGGIAAAALTLFSIFSRVVNNETDAKKPGDVFAVLRDDAATVANAYKAGDAQACYYAAPDKVKVVYFDEFARGPFMDAANFSAHGTPREIGALPIYDSAPCAIIDPAQRLTADRAREHAMNDVATLEASPAGRALVSDAGANDRQGRLYKEIIAP